MTPDHQSAGVLKSARTELLLALEIRVEAEPAERTWYDIHMPAAGTETKSFAPPGEAPEREPPRPQFSIGSRVGRYEIVGPLASGGMADVWIGRGVETSMRSRLVAIKTVRAEYANDETFRKMFFREVRLASAIRHANVVELLDVGETNGTPFQVMNLIDGTTLSILVRKQNGPLPVSVACTILADVLRGLHAAHEAVDERGNSLGIVHRDISPQNILVGLDGVARISDFGIAKGLHLADERTATDQLRGKWGYFAPEQVQRAPNDRRSDLFSTGIVLWEALTGRRLFKGNDVLDTLDQITRAVIVSPSTINSRVPQEISEVCMMALARDLDERFATAKDMGAALTLAMNKAGVAYAPDELARFVEDIAGQDTRDTLALARAPHRLSIPDETVSEGAAVKSELVVDARSRPNPRLRAVIASIIGAAALVTVGVWLGRRDVSGAAAAIPAPISENTATASQLPSALEPSTVASLAATATPIGKASPSAMGIRKSFVPPTTTRPSTAPSLPVNRNPYR